MNKCPLGDHLCVGFLVLSLSSCETAVRVRAYPRAKFCTPWIIEYNKKCASCIGFTLPSPLFPAAVISKLQLNI